MASPSIAGSEKDGEWQEQTSFFYGTVWREQAEHVAESLQKGARVIVSGRMEQRTWRDKEDQQRESIEVVIDEIGPSLRWATASVNRTERTGGDWAGGGGGGGGGGRRRGSRRSPGTGRARESYGPDEAPF